ncbi:MAG: hypothetical protein SGARI_000113, partial [Bacillariaceae sp.]
TSPLFHSKRDNTNNNNKMAAKEKTKPNLGLLSPGQIPTDGRLMKQDKFHLKRMVDLHWHAFHRDSDHNNRKNLTQKIFNEMVQYNEYFVEWDGLAWVPIKDDKVTKQIIRARLKGSVEPAARKNYASPTRASDAKKVSLKPTKRPQQPLQSATNRPRQPLKSTTNQNTKKPRLKSPQKPPSQSRLGQSIKAAPTIAALPSIKMPKKIPSQSDNAALQAPPPPAVPPQKRTFQEAVDAGSIKVASFSGEKEKEERMEFLRAKVETENGVKLRRHLAEDEDETTVNGINGAIEIFLKKGGAKGYLKLVDELYSATEQQMIIPPKELAEWMTESIQRKYKTISRHAPKCHALLFGWDPQRGQQVTHNDTYNPPIGLPELFGIFMFSKDRPGTIVHDCSKAPDHPTIREIMTSVWKDADDETAEEIIRLVEGCEGALQHVEDYGRVLYGTKENRMDPGIMEQFSTVLLNAGDPHHAPACSELRLVGFFVLEPEGFQGKSYTGETQCSRERFCILLNQVLHVKYGHVEKESVHVFINTKQMDYREESGLDGAWDFSLERGQAESEKIVDKHMDSFREACFQEHQDVVKGLTSLAIEDDKDDVEVEMTKDEVGIALADLEAQQQRLEAMKQTELQRLDLVQKKCDERKAERNLRRQGLLQKKEEARKPRANLKKKCLNSLVALDLLELFEDEE